MQFSISRRFTSFSTAVYRQYCFCTPLRTASIFTPSNAQNSLEKCVVGLSHQNNNVTRRRGAPITAQLVKKLATKRTVVPDGRLHSLKGDVSPTLPMDGLAPVPLDAQGMVLLKSMTLKELEHWVVSLGHKKFRARQLWKWLYKSDKLAATFDEMTDVSKPFRKLLNETARVDSLSIDNVHQSADGTRKITYRLDGGGVIETVLIPTEDRTTICISSQFGKCKHIEPVITSLCTLVL